MSVPTYLIKEDGYGLNRKQAGFFRRWKNGLQREEFLGLDGQFDYIRRYMYDIAISPPYEESLNQLLKIQNAYDINYKDGWSLINSIFDCYLLLGQFETAISFLNSHIDTKYQQQSVVSNILTLKAHQGISIRGKEILGLYGPNVTDFGLQYLDDIEVIIDDLINYYEAEKSVNLIREWIETAHSYPYNRGRQNENQSNPIFSMTFYSFRDCKRSKKFTKKIMRIAENIFRLKTGHPLIGQGWISETELFNLLKTIFTDITIKQHSSPEWLGRQHLDIYLPNYSLAIEYQGIQHDQPVEFFGGQEAFEENKKRDKRKQNLCKKNGIHLIYVRPGYDLQNLVEEIVGVSGITVDLSKIQEKNLTPKTLSQEVESLRKQVLEIDLTLKKPNPIPKKQGFDDFDLPVGLNYHFMEIDSDYEPPKNTWHQFRELANQIYSEYKKRNDNPDVIYKVIELCREQISMSYDALHYFYHENQKSKEWSLQQAEEFKLKGDYVREKEYRESAKIFNKRRGGRNISDMLDCA